MPVIIFFELIIRLGHKLNFARVLPPKSKCEYKLCLQLALLYSFSINSVGPVSFVNLKTYNVQCSLSVCVHCLHYSFSHSVSQSSVYIQIISFFSIPHLFLSIIHTHFMLLLGTCTCTWICIWPLLLVLIKQICSFYSDA